ncbi:mannose-6-phosphate isomerase, class I [Priestia megaterium]|uniref:mannose-6-phosphate isomerase, class I n=1 Tax=Priestia megaterium TaxID=1404 RepID=UPI002452E137|nr:mannose-6-phosphate isomerase, class I [Priestia megaterium]MDH3183714.1 mannose-6-phosphate isomerase, class I [Priestia megaterium]
MKEPIFLTPIFQERIWGGSRLKETYDYPIKSPLTGECWAISAHPHGESSVRCGEHKGLTLSELWNNHRHLFGNHGSEKFPLLTKILDANEDLSVQVHPDDDYAKEHENGESGKTECWYVIDCAEDADIIIGHHAQTKKEFINKIKNGCWDQLLQRIKIKPGDFFYIPSGTLHAICKGTLLLETQQNSDTTYRVYDYDRRDKNGNLRELHLQKSLDVITIPHKESKFTPESFQTKEATIITFIKSDYFTVSKWIIKDQLSMKQNQLFMLFSVIEGKGFLETNKEKYALCKGDHFILPYELGNFNIKGNIQFIVSYPSSGIERQEDK